MTTSERGSQQSKSMDFGLICNILFHILLLLKCRVFLGPNRIHFSLCLSFIVLAAAFASKRIADELWRRRLAVVAVINCVASFIIFYEDLPPLSSN